MSKLTDIYTQKILLREHGEEINGFRSQPEEKREVQIGKEILENINSLIDTVGEGNPHLSKIDELAVELLVMHGASIT
jgi:hypothetical protein